MNPASQRKRVPEHITKAMTAIIDHFWLEQVQQYLASSRDVQREHIFNDLLTVRQWLQNSTLTVRGGRHGQ